MLALAGCGTKDAGTAGGSASTETEQASVKSKVKFDGTYTAGDTVKIQMDLTKKEPVIMDISECINWLRMRME